MAENEIMKREICDKFGLKDFKIITDSEGHIKEIKLILFDDAPKEELDLITENVMKVLRKSGIETKRTS